jgi:AcrR family transcriptional regulator
VTTVDEASVPDDVIGPYASTRERLILTAEHLFAAHGLEGVSLKQICVAARQANRSAVQYHFGSKEGLVKAIFEYRLPAINRRRSAMLLKLEALGRTGNVRGLIEAILVPLADESEYGTGRYAGFLYQLTLGGSAKAQYYQAVPESTATTSQALTLLDEALADVQAPIRHHRRSLVLTQITTAVAQREYALRDGSAVPPLPYALFLSDLLDFLTHAAAAPVSETTRQAIAAMSPTVHDGAAALRADATPAQGPCRCAT